MFDKVRVRHPSTGKCIKHVVFVVLVPGSMGVQVLGDIESIEGIHEHGWRATGLGRDEVDTAIGQELSELCPRIVTKAEESH